MLHRPRFDRLINSYELLASNVASGVTSTAGAPPRHMAKLLESDYPNVDYWRRATWTKEYKDKARVSRVANNATAKKTKAPKTIAFIQHADGTVADLHRLTAIRRAIRAGWHTLRTEGKLQAKWTETNGDELKVCSQCNHSVFF